ncbi:hypothetical protein HDE_08808 [Halotydeus destructor]|nr:hypothetical protein HDE_08808 [Halotydeus destructor]
MEHRFKIQCDLTLSERLESSPTASANFFLPFHREKKTVEITVNEDTIVIKLANTRLSEKTPFSIFIIKVDGSKVELLAPDYTLQVQDYSHYIRHVKRLLFRIEIFSEGFNSSREYMRSKRLYESIDAEPSDFLIQTHDGSLKVMKNVLAIQWEFFKTLIESKCEECSNNIWVVQDFDLEVMRDVGSLCL